MRNTCVQRLQTIPPLLVLQSLTKEWSSQPFGQQHLYGISYSLFACFIFINTENIDMRVRAGYMSLRIYAPPIDYIAPVTPVSMPHPYTSK